VKRAKGLERMTRANFLFIDRSIRNVSAVVIGPEADEVGGGPKPRRRSGEEVRDVSAVVIGGQGRT
jgi:hypothetical protein